jgi:hypothetical protein
VEARLRPPSHSGLISESCRVPHLSPSELLIVRNAFERAWNYALREDLVSGWNEADVENSLVQGILVAMSAGERDEKPLVAAALAKLSIDEEDYCTLLTATFHRGTSSIH